LTQHRWDDVPIPDIVLGAFLGKLLDGLHELLAILIGVTNEVSIIP
jgi:hypothetical protein